jgi:hypothetical protein
MVEQAAATPRAGTENRFRTLVERWKQDSAFLSSVSDMIALGAYQEIIGMGAAAIPLLLRELEQDPHYWFWALQAITGEDPVPVEMRGNVAEMIQAWLRWGKEKGYRW